ncbi:BTAD domain-containing putative transcriptional regulator [Streptomyces sp. NPDC002851]
MRFKVLGPLEVWTSDGRAVRVPEARIRTLLTVLLVHRGRAVPVDRLIDALWGDAPPAHDVRTLRSKVSLLRRVLEEAEPGGRELVESRRPGYLLRVDDDAVDAGKFEALLGRASAAGSEPRARAGLLGEALGLWRDEVAFADHADAEFVRAEAQRLEERRLVAVEERAEARLELGEHAVVAGELGAWVATHPLRERLRAAQVRALYLAGRQDEALASLGEVRTRLRDELGVDPGRELAALHEAILRQDGALVPAPRRHRRNPPTSGPHRRGNLPAQLTELVGRARQARQIGALLASERLVTLTGTGGVGKTRLALEAAAGRAGDFADGVWLVELASAGTGAEVREAVAAVLGLREELRAPERSVPGRLADALADRNMLLVLDNCEHVVEPVAELAAGLLRTAPGLRVLATSQEPLAVIGERLWPVAPLGLPGPDAGRFGESGTDRFRESDPDRFQEPETNRVRQSDPDRFQEPETDRFQEPEADRFRESELDRFGESDAVRLFVARATAADPAFRFGPDNAAAVATICRRLDGIPLALEMAAARVRVMPVAELAERLDDRFRVLTATLRGAPSRQRTLRAALDWSWGLLGEAEQVVLRRLAVFADGCTLAAAEAVCAGGRVRRKEVLEMLGRLVDRSLVGQREGRYRLLETVAAYGAERLAEAGDADGVEERLTRERHLAYYVEVVERAEERLRGPEQRVWLGRLDAEAANVRGALAYAVRREDAGSALRLVNGLAWFWFLRGRFAEARRSLDLALAVGGAPGRGRAAARSWRAGMSLMLFDTREPGGELGGGPGGSPGGGPGGSPGGGHGRSPSDGPVGSPGGEASDSQDGEAGGAGGAGGARDGEAVLAAYDDGVKDPAGRARARWFVALGRTGFGDAAVTYGLADRAYADFDALGDRWGAAAALAVRAEVLLYQGEQVRAGADARRARELFGELGDGWGQLQAACTLGDLAEAAGDYRTAQRLRQEGHRLATELELWHDAAKMLARLGRTALIMGDLERAEELHERARQLAVAHGYRRGEEFAEVGLGLVARRRGRFEVAERHLLAWLDWCRRWEGDHGVAFILAELGFIAEQRGDGEAARELHREGLVHARRTGDPRALALAFEGLAGAEALAGDLERAAYLLGAAAAARVSAGVPLPAGERGDVDRIEAVVRAGLTPQAYERTFRSGSAQGNLRAITDVLPDVRQAHALLEKNPAFEPDVCAPDVSESDV